jgi:hypothetical protein
MGQGRAMTKEQQAWRRRYNRYLAGTEWQRTRARALRRDGHRCTRCGRNGDRGNPLQANHKSYQVYNRTGRTLSRDLETLCRRCHERATGRRFSDGYRGGHVGAKPLVRRRKLLRWVIITAIGLGSYAICSEPSGLWWSCGVSAILGVGEGKLRLDPIRPRI